jgi:glutathione S-transferase
VTATLVGQLDSPYVRRVAASALLLGVEFMQQPWSVGADQARLRQVNPLGRVPAWIGDDGEVLVDSAQIVEHLDDLAGYGNTLMPGEVRERFVVRQWLGLLTGVLDKGIAIVIERVFGGSGASREALPTQPQVRDDGFAACAAPTTPWTARCRDQLHSGLAEVERECAARGGSEWLAHRRVTQADITFACFLTYLRDALPLDLAPYPALADRLARIEALPQMQATYVPFTAPVPTESTSA